MIHTSVTIILDWPSIYYRFFLSEDMKRDLERNIWQKEKVPDEVLMLSLRGQSFSSCHTYRFPCISYHARLDTTLHTNLHHLINALRAGCRQAAATQHHSRWTDPDTQTKHGVAWQRCWAEPALGSNQLLDCREFPHLCWSDMILLFHIMPSN